MTTDLVSRDTNLENPHVLGIRRLPARASIVPAQIPDVFYRDKERSDRILSLNGVCRFAWRERDSLSGFEAPSYADGDWDTAEIPSMWQYSGYDKPRYPNVRYDFPFDPPYIHKRNPVGYYRKTFSLTQVPAHAILHFGGVDNAFYVYVNGQFAGFSKGSRNVAEFDVGAFLRAGENVMAVKVFTYSDASYLEDQDMLLCNGIFRDVYLYLLGETYLWDYRVTTTEETVCVKTELRGDLTGAKVVLTLDGMTGETTGESDSHTFRMQNPKLWNAEEPNLYTLRMTVMKDGRVCEIHSKRIGIMQSAIRGKYLTVNGKPIMIKGVNRHDNNAKKGKALSVADIEHDLYDIKSNHLNAIRTSHYPNDPALYEIANEIGIYVLDEGDIETHGCGDATSDQGWLSKNPDWLDAFVDRTTRIFETNKNEVCIFMRNVGNECGDGHNLRVCSELLAEWDPRHVTVQNGDAAADDDLGTWRNFQGIGYYPLSVLQGLDPEGAPVVAVEYAHAMGNSPGGLKDYWDWNYTHEAAAGGFVWEYRSHGFYQEDEEGRPFYQYGGDFDDKYSWSNFTLDGYCTSDGGHKPSWQELGTVLFPAYARVENGDLLIKNTNDFTFLPYTCAYEIKRDGEVIAGAPLSVADVAPRETFSCPCPAVPETPVPGAVYDLDVVFYENGKEAMRKQFRLPDRANALPAQREPFACTVRTDGDVLTVTGDDFYCAFTKGMLSSLEKDGKQRLAGAMKMNFYRAPTDNDGIVNLFPRHIKEWNDHFLNVLEQDVTSVTLTEKEDRLVLTAVVKCIADTMWEGFDVKLVYEIMAHGVIFINVEGTPFGTMPEILPRIGVVIPVPSAFDTVRWAGRGPGENYPDEKTATTVGRYTLPVAKMNFLYDVPQETGNRENVRFVRLCDGDGALTVAAKDDFAFSCHDFTLENLTQARHRNELQKSPVNYLYVDYKMRGLGSLSCGVDPEPAYELYTHAFRFCFTLSCADETTALQLARTDFGASTEALSGHYQFNYETRKQEFLDCDEHEKK